MDIPQTLTGPLDLDLIRNAPLTQQPWPHSVIDGAVSDPDTLRRLVDTFPATGFRVVEEPEPDQEGKTFVVEARNDVDGVDLDPLWRAFLDQAQSEAYRRAVGHLGGVTLKGSQCRVAFYRYPPQAWLGVHRDEPHKILSHVFYLNDDWPADAGGDLLILDQPDLASIRRRIAPTAGTSVVVVRGDESWHAVQKVSATLDRPRCSIIVVFYTAGADLSHYDT